MNPEMAKSSGIIKNPYSGFSPFLIESFSIIGYDVDKIEELSKRFKKNAEKQKPDTPYDYEDDTISFLSTITASDQIKINKEIIISSTFPGKPVINYIFADKIQSQDDYVVVYQTRAYTGEKKMNIFCSFSYVFYEEINKDGLLMQVPKCFNIISRYPLFSFYKHICENLKNEFIKKDLEIPLEFQIFNFVHFLYNPINYPIDYDIFLNTKLCAFDSISDDELQFANIESPTIYSLNQSSGYPNLDIRILEIFKLFDVEQIIKILMFSFLEYDMIFFSKNVEILNAMLVITSNLSYPYDDTNYLSNIISVSKKECGGALFRTGGSSIRGITCSYASEDELGTGRKRYLTVEIDKGSSSSISVYNENEEDPNEDIKFISELIKNSINVKSMESSDLEKSIYDFYKKLRDINERWRDKNDGKKEANFYAKKTLGDLEREFQVACYDFVLEMVFVIYKTVTGRDGNRLTENHNNVVGSEETFIKLFKDTIKQATLFSFLLDFNKTEEYQVSSYFAEEFLNLKKSMNKIQIPYFDIIDSFYSKNKHLQKNNEKVVANFQKFYKFYNDQEVSPKLILQIAKLNASPLKIFKNQKITNFIYSTKKLDQNIINIYTNLLKEKNKEIPKIFPFSDEIKVPTFDISEITSCVEDYLVLTNSIKHVEMIYYSCLLNFITTSEYFPDYQSSVFTIFFEQLHKDEKSRLAFERLYINLFLNMYYRIAEKKKNENVDCLNERNMLQLCRSYVCEWKIFCTQETSNLITKFKDLEGKSQASEHKVFKFEPYKYKVMIEGCRCPEFVEFKNRLINFDEDILNRDYKGQIIFNCPKCKKYINPKIIIQCVKRYKFPLISPRFLHSQSKRLFEGFKEKLTYARNEINDAALGQILVNIIFYLGNRDDLPKEIQTYFLDFLFQKY